MGRNSGGVSGSGAGKVKANKGTTETGYTAKMVKNIVGIEQKYRTTKMKPCMFSHLLAIL